jgi:hypothetical protein
MHQDHRRCRSEWRHDFTTSPEATSSISAVDSPHYSHSPSCLSIATPEAFGMDYVSITASSLRHSVQGVAILLWRVGNMSHRAPHVRHQTAWFTRKVPEGQTLAFRSCTSLSSSLHFSFLYVFFFDLRLHSFSKFLFCSCLFVCHTAYAWARPCSILSHLPILSLEPICHRALGLLRSQEGFMSHFTNINVVVFFIL